MAKHEIMIHENTGATKETAPYLGTYVTKSTVKIDPISEAVSKLCGLPAIQVQTILSGAFDQIAKMEREEGAIRVNFDGFAVCQVIKGTFPASDSQFDPDVNSLVLAIELKDDVRNALVNVTPTIVTDETSTKIRVDNVADTEVPRPYQVVYGKRPFCVTGLNLVMNDEGAEVYLEDSKGIKYPCTVDEMNSKQEFTAHSDALLDGGDYKLWVRSRGGDSEGQLQSDFRKVKYIHVMDPFTVTRIAAEGSEDVIKDEAFYVTGTNLSYGAGDSVKVKWTQSGTAHELTVTPSATTPTKMTFEPVAAFDDIPEGTFLTFVFNLRGQTEEFQTMLVDA